MKYLITSILFFITINSFAINQKLVDGAERYESAVKNLKETETAIQVKHKTLTTWLKELDAEKNKNSNFRSDAMIGLYQEHIDETKNTINNLKAQYAQTKGIIEKLEPIKLKYDKQIEKSRKREELKTALLNITGMLILPLSVFVFIFWVIVYMRKKCQQLLKKGKISQDEYDRLMSVSHEKATLFSDDDRTNPATGLRMIGGCDSGGNPYGCTFRNSTSETHRTRWD